MKKNGKSHFPGAPDLGAIWAENCAERRFIAIQQAHAPDSDGMEFPDPAQVEQECIAEGPGNRSLVEIAEDTKGMRNLRDSILRMRIDA